MSYLSLLLQYDWFIQSEELKWSTWDTSAVTQHFTCIHFSL